MGKVLGSGMGRALGQPLLLIWRKGRQTLLAPGVNSWLSPDLAGHFLTHSYLYL